MTSLALVFLSVCFVWVTAIQTREIRGLKLRIADLDRDLTALEGSLTGDGR